ncbi:MAG TPA: YncE family protein [Ktedonobacteraceae bacterium]|nr:YncE family protein [Ktedonobacteraceae bacterium]
MGRRCMYALLLIVFFALSSPFSSMSVYADGGAPNLAYVSGTTGGIGVIDVGQGKVTKSIAVTGDPHTILLSQDGRYLYVTQPAIDQIAVIAARTGEVVCSAHLPGTPTLLALDLNTNILFAAGNGATDVSAINPTNCKVLRSFITQTPVYGLTLASPGTGLAAGNSTQLWVANAQNLMVFNDLTGQLLATIPLLDGPQYLTAPPGDMVYATTRQGSVDAINFQTQAVRQLITGGLFGPMDYDALTSEVYVPDQRHHVLDVLTPITASTTTLPPEPNRLIPTSSAPASVAVTSDGLLGFVALQNGNVAMYDLIDRQLVFTLPVGGTPHFVITGLYPPTVDVTPTPPPETSSSPHAQVLQNGAIIILVVALLIMVLFLGVILAVLRTRRNGRS